MHIDVENMLQTNIYILFVVNIVRNRVKNKQTIDKQDTVIIMT